MIGQSGSTTFTTGGPGPTSVTVPMRSFEKVGTIHRHRFSILDLALIDYNYVKARGDKLVCFIKYSIRTGQFSSSIKENALDSVKPTETGPDTKVKDWTATENARYELENNKWVIKESGISELGKLRQIDELKASAASAQPPAPVQH